MSTQLIRVTLFAISIALPAAPALAFDSGSTGADGAFAPAADTQLVMPQSGIFNFTTVDIPAGVDVTFKKNASNTPVIIRASGDVNIAGVLTANGGNGRPLGNTPAATDGDPGIGGPGGGDGGRGGIYASTGSSNGGEGRSLGGGHPGVFSTRFNQPCGGGGGGYGSAGGNAGSPVQTTCQGLGALGGPAYGSNAMLPLLGGSGGAGGSGGNTLFGSGGGGGGGALLIASSGTVNISGTVRANGGQSGGHVLAFGGGAGGGGSGGAIRIVATTITGEGTINAVGGFGNGVPNCGLCKGGNGGTGRIRLEAENLQRLANTNPAYTFSAPRPIFFTGLPTLRITSVGGIAAPAVPTGDRDVVLPGFTSNPVTVDVATTGVPLGNTITLLAKPTRGTQTSANTSGVTGSEASGTASGDINLPNGASVLTAQTTFTVTASLGDALKNYAEGERVERIELAAAPGKGSTTTLITVSGKRFIWPSSAVALN